ncbi:ATP synthase subunit mitochondrial-like, partial [Trifolium pratense]
MALFSRVKSGISLCNKLGLLSSQRSTLQSSLIAPSISQASRNFADVPGQRDPKIKVPIAMFGGSGNYASALYIAAVKANAIEKVDAELSQFVESVKNSPLISQFIKDISVKKDVRVKTIQEIASEAKFSDVTKSFLDLHCGVIHLPCFEDFIPRVITCSNSLLCLVIFSEAFIISKTWFSIGFISDVVLHQLFQFLFDIGFVSFGVSHWFCVCSSGLAMVTLAAFDSFSQFLCDLGIFPSFNLVLTLVPNVPVPDNLQHRTILFGYFSLSKGKRKVLILLAENGRLKYVDTIAKRFAELAMAYKGEVKAIVTTVL